MTLSEFWDALVSFPPVAWALFLVFVLVLVALVWSGLWTLWGVGDGRLERVGFVAVVALVVLVALFVLGPGAASVGVP